MPPPPPPSITSRAPAPRASPCGPPARKSISRAAAEGRRGPPDGGNLVTRHEAHLEAETLTHQVLLLRALGPEVNLGPNIAPFHVPAKLEPFRHGIGSEVDYSVFGHVLEATGADVSKLLS
jgi:hypothetical protein